MLASWCPRKASTHSLSLFLTDTLLLNFQSPATLLTSSQPAQITTLSPVKTHTHVNTCLGLDLCLAVHAVWVRRRMTLNLCMAVFSQYNGSRIRSPPVQSPVLFGLHLYFPSVPCITDSPASKDFRAHLFFRERTRYFSSSAMIAFPQPRSQTISLSLKCCLKRVLPGQLEKK